VFREKLKVRICADVDSAPCSVRIGNEHGVSTTLGASMTDQATEDQQSGNAKPLVATQQRKGRTRYDHNPFLNAVVEALTGKKVKVTMKSNMSVLDGITGEISPIEGQITKFISADREGFVKLYTAQLDAFFELRSSSRKVVKYLIHNHQQSPNRHRVTLHPDYAKEDGFEIPKSTWYDGINELIEKKFIAPAKAQNDYYLNPAIFFNGDRTRLVVELRRSDQKQRENLERLGQERLSFDEDTDNSDQ
jgi:hypothetical protein